MAISHNIDHFTKAQFSSRKFGSQDSNGSLRGFLGQNNYINGSRVSSSKQNGQQRAFNFVALCSTLVECSTENQEKANKIV